MDGEFHMDCISPMEGYCPKSFSLHETYFHFWHDHLGLVERLYDLIVLLHLRTMANHRLKESCFNNIDLGA